MECKLIIDLFQSLKSGRKISFVSKKVSHPPNKKAKKIKRGGVQTVDLKTSQTNQ